MNDLVRDVIKEIQPQVIEQVTSKFSDISADQASGMLDPLVSNLIQSIQGADQAELMQLAGQFMNKNSGSMDLNSLNQNPVIQNLINTGTQVIQGFFNKDQSSSFSILQMILPLIMNTLGKKYQSNPLSLLSLLNNNNSGSVANIASMAGKLGGFFGK